MKRQGGRDSERTTLSGHIRSALTSSLGGLVRSAKAAALLSHSKLTKAVFAFDLIFGQAADARERAAAVCYRDGYEDFVGARGVVDANFHAVEVAADEGGIFVAERNVEGDSGAAAFFGRGNERGAFSKGFADGRAEFGMKNGGGVVEVIICAERCGAAVALRGSSGTAQCRDRALG